MTLAQTMRARHLKAGAGQRLSMLADSVTIMALAADTGGSYALFEALTPPAGGCPPHVQRYEDETVYVLDGRYAFQLGDRTLDLGPGDYVFIPRGVTHAYANAGPVPARLLLMVTPGGIHDQFVTEVGAHAARHPAEAPLVKALAVAPKYGIAFAEPNLARHSTRPGGLLQAGHVDRDGDVERSSPMGIATRPMTTAGPTLVSDILDDLRSRLTGALLTPGSAEYDAARALPYITVDRRPLAIVLPATAEDVAAAVTVAREHHLPLAARSGGHSLAHYGVIDDALVINLSGMKNIVIDPAARVARVQAGATSGDLAGLANAHGLALSTGDTSSVGFGGLTTGGGIGFMVRRHGLAIDNLLSAQVVTAAGEIVTASPTEHADLFWAIRGGGGNAGIVIEFTFRLAPVGQILGGELMLPASREVIRGYLDYATSAPDDLTTIANLMHAPPAPYVPQERIGELVLSILVCWTGNLEDGERALAPLRALATPVADVVAPIPYPAIYQFTAHQALPHAASLRSMFADNLSDATLDAALAAMRQATSPYSIIQFRGLGGVMARVDAEATAFAHRERRYLVAVIGIWLDAAEDAAVHAAWTESLWRRIQHEGDGVYVNFVEEEGASRVRDAYPPETYARLAAVKRAYDPDNLFRFNQNVPPRA